MKDKIYCPICGELEVIEGKVVHPHLDEIYAEMLNSGFELTYTK